MSQQSIVNPSAEGRQGQTETAGGEYFIHQRPLQYLLTIV